MKIPLALLAIIPCFAVAEPTLYLQGGLGYQIGMTERWTYEGERRKSVHKMDLPDTVGSFVAGVEYRGFLIEAQHVSSIETGKDHGFNVVTAGYRWEFSF
ncbi:hypothetical protein [Marinobacter sp. Hex_13]|uniref:hypothetical protein n=1 Tax=Marinobacter sp. Hex_13 TaxID=1795866 RepID=UPI000797A90C|nr:hypothetical protein [Marinobacter sp. Hex_13]KXJ45853.1 MAG: hypothetical protein AXW11_12240 [Marinobacter sp. Hex_13]